MMTFLKVLLVVNIFIHVHGDEGIQKDSEECDAIIGEKLKKEIASYGPTRDRILKYVLEGDFKGRTYKELAKFIDKFGTRLAGSESLERSIDYMIRLANKEGIQNITTEAVKVPQLTRGKEKITMLKPRVKNIALIGLFPSVSTPKDGITAEVLVVDSFAKLDNYTNEDVKGKIVLFNHHFTNYIDTVVYRYESASRAARKGAVASLVRSIASFSINSPHTGLQQYDNNTKKIPTAAIALEDASLLQRLFDEGKTIVLNIKMFSKLDHNVSRNTLIDARGREKPEKLVIVSGHIDCWDNGEGAMDDGGGLFISWAVPVILKRMNLHPRRTVRSIFWTAEEEGYIGAYAYEKKHRHEEKNLNFVMESDDGTFTPTGLQIVGTKKAYCIVAEVLKLFKVINASIAVDGYRSATDINVFLERGIPGAGLLNDNGRYFWFHHSAGDTMDVEDEHSLDLCTAFWTAVAYIIADLSVDIPRNETSN